MLLIDDIERLSTEAGLSSSDLRVKQLIKDAYDLGRQHEREACDAICKEAYEWAESRREREGSDPHFAGRMRAAQDIGQVIRARAQAERGVA